MTDSTPDKSSKTILAGLTRVAPPADKTVIGYCAADGAAIAMPVPADTAPAL